MKSFKSKSDQRLIEIFITKRVLIRLTFFGTQKYDCVINTKEAFNFLHLINKSIDIKFIDFTTDLTFLLLFLSAILSLNIMNILHFLLGL